MTDCIVNIDGIGDIRIISNERIRRISISIRPSGEIRLNFPPSASEHTALKFLQSKADWIIRTKRRLSERHTVCRRHSPAEIAGLRQSAKAELPALVESIALQYGFSYGKVTIRASRSKWGCCTGDNNISLSLFLMTLPEHLRRYVIIHELCHTVHHNHSVNFHALVDKCVGGNEKLLQSELRKYNTTM